MKIQEDALTNLSSSELNEFTLSSQELSFLSDWTYVHIFLVEANTALVLAEKYNAEYKTLDMEKLVLIHGMYRMALLSYAKCFSSAKGKVKLNADLVYADEPEIRKVHDRIMEIRNKHIAHNDQTNLDCCLNLVQQNDEEIVLAQTYTLALPISEFAEYFRTFDTLEKWLISNYNKKIDKIEARLGKRISFR